MTLKEIADQLETTHAELIVTIKERMKEEVDEHLQEMIGDIGAHGPNFSEEIKELCEAATAIIVAFSQIEGVITKDMVPKKADALAGLEPTVDDLDFDEEPGCDSGCHCLKPIYEPDE